MRIKHWGVEWEEDDWLEVLVDGEWTLAQVEVAGTDPWWRCIMQLREHQGRHGVLHACGPLLGWWENDGSQANFFRMVL